MKALPPKFTFKFRLPICGQGNKEKFGVFGRITWFLFFSKEMDPHLGHWQNQKQRSKLLNFALKKKKGFIQTNPTSAGQFVFQYLDTNYRRAQVQLGCSTRRWNPRIQPQIWMMASWNSRPQEQLQLPAQGLVKWNPRLQQRHLQSWYLEKHSPSPRRSQGLQGGQMPAWSPTETQLQAPGSSASPGPTQIKNF